MSKQRALTTAEADLLVEIKRQFYRNNNKSPVSAGFTMPEADRVKGLAKLRFVKIYKRTNHHAKSEMIYPVTIKLKLTKKGEAFK